MTFKKIQRDKKAYPRNLIDFNKKKKLKEINRTPNLNMVTKQLKSYHYLYGIKD